MKISVAIPTYNRVDIIGETLKSILSQTLRPAEIIICDDGSTDGTNEVLEQFKHQIKYKTIENSGPGNARKVAIDMCSSPWIALCDSDDFWKPQHLEDLSRTVIKYPDLEFIFCNFVLTGTMKGDKFSEAPLNWWYDALDHFNPGEKYFRFRSDAYRPFLRFNPCFPSTMLFSRDLYDRIGGISPEFSRTASEDAHLTRRLIAYGKCGCSFNATVEIRKHEDNFSSNVARNYVGRVAVLEKMHKNREVPEIFLKETQEEILRSSLKAFEQCYWHGEYCTARDMFKKIDRRDYNLRLLIQYCISVGKSLLISLK